MTRSEAISIIASSAPALGVRDVERDYCPHDDVAYWSAEIFDPELPEGEDSVGTAQFPEHWPEVDISWA